MVDCQDSRVGMEIGTGSLWISEDDKFEDHEYDDVMKHGVKDEDEIPKNKNDDDERRICHVCRKGFGSGKALGGHMRIHVQASKKLLLSGRKGKKSKPVLQTDEEEEDQVDDQLLPTCSICGKNFPSMKSLFGHMRCHPERAWRGIQPPEDIDRKTTVPVWSVTAKRGRKANAEDTTYSGSKDEEQLHDAVHHLMLLANGDSIESGLTGGIPEEFEKTNSNSLTSKAENENEASNKKKTKLRHLDSEKYKCNACGKTFATHQALGGHKSSHNKFRILIQNSHVTNIAANSEDAAASSQRILDFDLNELPPDHEDEQLSGNHDYYFPFFPM
ncbi:zinc finger protein ZAT1 [Capsicum chacoense]